MKLLAAVAAVAAVAAGTVQAQEPDPVPSRDCSTRIEPTRGRFAFRVPRDVVVGPVSFFGLERAATPKLRRSGPVFFFKAPAKVRAGAGVTVVVSPGMSLHFVRDSPKDRIDPAFAELRLEPCPPSRRSMRRSGGTVGPVTGFSGAFIFDRRGCYTIEVRVDGRQTPYRKRIPFGTRARCR